MLRIVLPPSLAAISAAYIRAVSALDVRVAVKIVVVIDGDVVVTAVPPAAVPPPSPPHCTHSYPDAEGNRHSGRVVARRWIGNGRVGVGWRTIHHGRVIAGNVNDLGIGLFDHNHLLALDRLGFNLHLFGGL